MASQKLVYTETFEAGADLSAKQFFFIKLSAKRKVILCANAADIPAGVLQNKPDASGKPAIVLVIGRSKINVDAGLAVGDLIGTSGDGQADKKIPGTDTSEFIVGQVTDGSSANAGEIDEAMINCASPARAA